MAKNANVSVRVEPEIKEAGRGLYGAARIACFRSDKRSLSADNPGIPFSLLLNSPLPVRSQMTDEEFNGMMTESLSQAKAGRGRIWKLYLNGLIKQYERI